jgi:hypothetical protein
VGSGPKTELANAPRLTSRGRSFRAALQERRSSIVDLPALA